MTTDNTAIYRCGNKKCSEYHKEIIAMRPAAYRFATGRPVTCAMCGDILWYVRASK